MLCRTKRESSHPNLFGSYKRFWRGCVWEKWLLPHHMGFVACQKFSINHLEFRPGVYEFAISKGNDVRYKMYIGESGSLRLRHQHYAKDGDHLFVLLDNAVRSGCTVWRRCKYVRTKKKAVKKEAKWLRKYDYPWNAKQNVKKRNVNLVSKSFCMCMSSVQIVE